MKRKIPEDTGATQREIVKFILDHPDGISEPTIREYLADKLKIKDPSNIKAHLEKLSNEKVIFKEHFRGRPNRWRLAYENVDEVANYLIWEFLKNADISDDYADLAIEVFKSKATQKFINESKLGQYFSNYLIPGSRWEKGITEIVNEAHITSTYYPLVSRSPTLFITIFEHMNEIEVISNCIYDFILETKDEEQVKKIEERIQALYHARILAPLLMDFRTYNNGLGDLIEYLDEVDEYDELYYYLNILKDYSEQFHVIKSAIIKDEKSDKHPVLFDI